MPSGLTNHRHAVLELLYTLLSSEQFGKEEVPMDHQRIALNLFLSLVEFTSPPPQFIARGWCTPALASKFVYIAFGDGEWARVDQRLNCHFASLIRRLFSFPPVVNKVFEYVAAERLFDQITERLRLHPSDIFDLDDPFSLRQSCAVQMLVAGLS